MAEVPFRPVRQLSGYKGKGASARREILSQGTGNALIIRRGNISPRLLFRMRR